MRRFLFYQTLRHVSRFLDTVIVKYKSDTDITKECEAVQDYKI